ncbi:hypothetical protein LHJ74_19365 [Streptomyces sp. N2-109]|uniref:Uncharacterized protein n=1 Tax=Streptomyces gossypii TaxID=2883101 RepID=A0ABT2JVW6_9ACTN|nr:hypothetical protein [Streptomyces gossypii]MCT2592035.1 hypothetical protein [Streptomyces gossypii]
MTDACGCGDAEMATAEGEEEHEPEELWKVSELRAAAAAGALLAADRIDGRPVRRPTRRPSSAAGNPRMAYSFTADAPACVALTLTGLITAARAEASPAICVRAGGPRSTSPTSSSCSAASPSSP